MIVSVDVALRREFGVTHPEPGSKIGIFTGGNFIYNKDFYQK